MRNKTGLWQALHKQVTALRGCGATRTSHGCANCHVRTWVERAGTACGPCAGLSPVRRPHRGHGQRRCDLVFRQKPITQKTSLSESLKWSPPPVSAVLFRMLHHAPCDNIGRGVHHLLVEDHHTKLPTLPGRIMAMWMALP